MSNQELLRAWAIDHYMKIVHDTNKDVSQGPWIPEPDQVVEFADVLVNYVQTSEKGN